MFTFVVFGIYKPLINKKVILFCFINPTDVKQFYKMTDSFF